MKIESTRQLREHRALARIRIKQLEEQIKDDFEEIKNDLKPLNLAGKALKNLLTSDKQTIVGESIGLTVDALIKKLVFRRAGFLTKTILSFVVKNYARNLAAKNSENILDWVQSLFLNLKKKHHSNGHYYDESTVDVDLER